MFHPILSPLVSCTRSLIGSGMCLLLQAVWPSWETNIIDPSGGSGNVHAFFHIYHDEHAAPRSRLAALGRALARKVAHNAEAYVEEPVGAFVSLLHSQEPGFGPYGPGKGPGGTNTSWMTPLETALGGLNDSPYTFGPGYSQFRKVNLSTLIPCSY